MPLVSTAQSKSSNRAVTLPLPSIIMSLTGQPSLKAFLALWEQQTGLSVDRALNSAVSQEREAISTFSDTSSVGLFYFGFIFVFLRFFRVYK